MLKCKDNPLTKDLHKETALLAKIKANKITAKAKMGNKFSADFQIFSYKIRLQTKTKKSLDKEEELSNQ